MIHAFDSKGRSRCGAVSRQGAPQVFQALYRDLCKECIAAIVASCGRRRG